MKEEDLKNYILQHFKYENGNIFRDDRKNSNGSKDKDGYIIYKVKGKQLKMHRIVWLLNYGVFPTKEIDHINRVRNDNRIENLRECTRIENIENTTKKINKDTGVVGIYLDKVTKGLKAKYSFRFKNKSYRFRNLEEAVLRRKELWKQIKQD